MASSQSVANDVLMAGSLSKRTKFTRKWKKFYWRLLSDGSLCRYKDIKQVKSLGQVDIKRDCYDIRHGLDASHKATFPSYIPTSCCFSILLTDKSYYMYADTPASANEWVKVLSNTSGVISRRRSETDAQFRELEKRRIALRNARQRRSRRNRADTISVDMVLECVEGELDHLEDIEDPYVTILPPSPSQFNSQCSTASLLRRSASVPHALSDNLPTTLTVISGVDSSGSMNSLYDEGVPHAPTQVAPTTSSSKNNFEGPSIVRRSSFSEDHPTLQRNTVLRETRKGHKRYFASPQVTSSTFKTAAVDDLYLSHYQPDNKPLVQSLIHTTGGPSTQSDYGVGVVNVLQQSNITNSISPSSQVSTSLYNRFPPVALNGQQKADSNNSEQFTSKEKVVHTFDQPDSSAHDDSIVFPVSPPRPTFAFSPFGNNYPPVNLAALARHSPKRLTHQNSLPDLMAPSRLTDINPAVAPANEIQAVSSPVVKRFTKAHKRCKSLSEFMPLPSVNNSENQKLHKALAIGGATPLQPLQRQAN